MKLAMRLCFSAGFLDLANERLSDELHDQEFRDSGSKIYTTLDPQLQRDAVEAVASGMREVQATLAKRQKHGGPVEDPQVALICLDPHTGEVKALIGGKNYGVSQLNHVLANRPSGSVFKAFVYSAALNTGLHDQPNPLTASTMVADEPQPFLFDGKPYEPVDYHHSDWKGNVTLRYAFANSLNVPAVEVAESTGYQVVADLAHKAGLSEINATPAMALGAYNVTPLAMSAAYTIFANNGVMVKPRLISRIADSTGKTVWHSEVQSTRILDPRVNFLMVSMMQEVLRSGTGGRVRAYGFSLPAAGKTGTSHDAWFAGFTSNLLCLVWVGLDNYQDLKIDGPHGALPIWADFMARAHKHREYRDVTDFSIPPGVVGAQIDPDSGQLATSTCPKTRTEYYLAGTQPVQYCSLHGGASTQIAGWGTALPFPAGIAPAAVPLQPSSAKPPPFPDVQRPLANPSAAPSSQLADQQSPDSRKKKKPGVFDKLKGIFR